MLAKAEGTLSIHQTLTPTAAKAVRLWGKTGEGSPSGLWLSHQKTNFFGYVLENFPTQNSVLTRFFSCILKQDSFYSIFLPILRGPQSSSQGLPN